MARKLHGALVAALLFVFCLPAAAQSEETYTISAGDRLDVSVLEDPGLNRQILVRPDGRFSMPLAGTIDAANKTPEQVEATIRARLGRDFVSPPTVTVSLLSLASDQPGDTVRIYLIGQVSGPGMYDMEAPVDILQALAASGGLGAFAAADRIQVRRHNADGDAVLLFNYDLIEEGAAPSQAMRLVDGDVIVVPQRRLFE